MISTCSVTEISAQQYYAGGKAHCAVDPANFKMGLGMYLSYFCLFAVLFYNLYLKPGGKHKSRSEKSNGGKGATSQSFQVQEKVCGVDLKTGDAAGFFHTVKQEVSKSKAA